jgi:hypothetical protein
MRSSLMNTARFSNLRVIEIATEVVALVTCIAEVEIPATILAKCNSQLAKSGSCIAANGCAAMTKQS